MTMTPTSSRSLVSLHRVSAALYPANPPPTTRTRFGKSLYGTLSHGSYLCPVRSARRTTSAAAAPPPTASALLSSLFMAPPSSACRMSRSNAGTRTGVPHPAVRRSRRRPAPLPGFPVQAPLHQEVHAVEDCPEQQQQRRQLENGDVAHGLVDQEPRGDHGTEDGEDGRGPEVLVPDLVSPQHEDRDVHHHERYKEQHDRGAA